MNKIDVLKQAREKISDENVWTKGSYATDDEHLIVGEKSGEACHWCLMGAVYSISDYESELSNEIENDLDKYVGSSYKSIIDFNDRDETTHADVLKVLDGLIGQLEGQAENRT